MRNRGFTLVELLLVITMIVILSGVTYSMSIPFFAQQLLHDTTHEFVTALREVQARAFAQKNDSNFGVKILADSYVLFQGNTFESRLQSEDVLIPLNPFVTIEGEDEIVFEKFTGIPRNPSVFTVSSYTYSDAVYVHEIGRIESTL